MAYIPKTIPHSEKVALLKQEVLRYSRMGLQPRHIAAKLEIPTYSVYNYKMLMERKGIDTGPKKPEDMTRGDRIVKSKMIKFYNQLETQEESNGETHIPIEETASSVFIPLEAKERENIMISFEEEGLKIMW